MKIEKDKPIPGKYPFADMEIGDSFVIPPHIKRQTAHVAALRYSKASGKKFTIRKTPEGYCCWRIA